MVVAKTGDRCNSSYRENSITDDRLFAVYPNPSTGKLFVSLNGHVGEINFSVFNSLGQKVFAKNMTSFYSKLELDLTHLPKGIYYLKGETNDKTAIEKVMLR